MITQFSWSNGLVLGITSNTAYTFNDKGDVLGEVPSIILYLGFFQLALVFT